MTSVISHAKSDGKFLPGVWMSKSEVFPYVFGSLEISAIPIFGELVNQLSIWVFVGMLCDVTPERLCYIHLANQLKLERVLGS